jgi:hypothetical protein
MRRFLRENGLSLVLFFLFVLPFLLAQSLSGHLENNSELQEHGQPSLTYAEYLRDPHFWEATTENWESEFLQMFAYVFLTIFLFQKGSSESKKLYESSLSLAFLLFFLASFFIHAVSGRGEYNEEQALHGAPPVSLGDFMTSSRFWFESFQNWQSEFLAIWAMVVFSIWLRQRGSPESKPVDSAHSATGSE